MDFTKIKGPAPLCCIGKEKTSASLGLQTILLKLDWAQRFNSSVGRRKSFTLSRCSSHQSPLLSQQHLIPSCLPFPCEHKAEHGHIPVWNGLYPITAAWQLTREEKESTSDFVGPRADKGHTTHQQQSSHQPSSDSQHDERRPETSVHCTVKSKARWKERKSSSLQSTLNSVMLLMLGRAGAPALLTPGCYMGAMCLEPMQVQVECHALHNGIGMSSRG